MKFCLSSHNSQPFLKQADEIKFIYKDRKAIPDFAEKYENVTIILHRHPTDEMIDWKEMNTYKILCKEKFILCLYTLMDCEQAKKNGINFYFGYNINTFYELQSLKEMGACYVRLGAPIFFQMPKVRQIGVPVRVVPNVSRNDVFPHENGFFGTWIRPEDIDSYKDYVETVEFENVDSMSQEQAYFRIYKEQKEWPGKVNLLISDIGTETPLNRMISSEATIRRLSCGQRCQEGGACRICERIMTLADRDMIKAYAAERT